MPVISRATLSPEFFDHTSERLLIQPEPQYVLARLLFMSNAAAEFRRTGISLGLTPERAIPDMGAGVGSYEDMQLLLSDPIRAEAIFTSDELAPGKHGHTIRINRPVFAGAGYTEASRTVASGQNISTVPIDLSMEQVSITIKRQVGPYGSAGTAPQPYGIDRMDAEHSVHSIAANVGMQLYRDRIKYLDTVIGTYFDAGSTVLYPSDPNNAITADATAYPNNTAGTRPFDAEVVFRTEESLATANIPRFANGKYVMIISPRQARQLKGDAEFQRLSVLDPSRNPLQSAYIRTLGGVEIYESNTAPTDTATVSGLTIHHAAAFGPGAVGYANAGPCIPATSSDDNYGETVKVIWRVYEGLALLDNRFIVNVHSN